MSDLTRQQCTCTYALIHQGPDVCLELLTELDGKFGSVTMQTGKFCTLLWQSPFYKMEKIALFWQSVGFNTRGTLSALALQCLLDQTLKTKGQGG